LVWRRAATPASADDGARRSLFAGVRPRSTASRPETDQPIPSAPPPKRSPNSQPRAAAWRAAPRPPLAPSAPGRAGHPPPACVQRRTAACHRSPPPAPSRRDAPDIAATSHSVRMRRASSRRRSATGGGMSAAHLRQSVRFPRGACGGAIRSAKSGAWRRYGRRG
jgi:hypothetical protein